jgi:cation transport ATPase
MELDVSEAARERIAARSRERERRAAKRERRERILLWLLAPIGLPALGAAAGVATLEAAGGDLAGWSTASAVGLAAAVLGLPAALTGWLARHRGRLELVAWVAITLAAELALLFWVGFVALGYGPD